MSRPARSFPTLVASVGPRGRAGLATALALLGSLGASARADVIPREVLRSKRAAATLDQPLRLLAGDGRVHEGPVWSSAGLWSAPPQARLAGLRRAGVPIYDPSTHAWYATASGALVRIDDDGGRPVVFCCLQGRDVDVRAALQLAVSREPDHSIVLWHWTRRGEPPRRTVLRRDEQLFGPRLSPDGRRLLLLEARPDGAGLWLLSLDGHGRYLGRADHATWHPDGRRIVFTLLAHDGHHLTAGQLWVLDSVTGSRSQLSNSHSVVPVRPAVSSDGRWVAFADGRTGDIYAATLPVGR